MSITPYENRKTRRWLLHRIEHANCQRLQSCVCANHEALIQG